MGADTVDDLHAAEDLAGHLAWALKHLLSSVTDDLARRRAQDALAHYETFCRPTCAWPYEGECREADPTCGCPCGHGED
jgi:hypothetical protein